MRLIIISIFLLTLPDICFCQRLKPFTSESGKVYSNGISRPVPYEKVVTFYDLLEVDEKADTLIDGISYYYLYFYLPAEVTEIGVRMISPVPPYVFAMPGDKVASRFNRDVKEWFDPTIFLEAFTSDSLNPDSLWIVISKNENSSETIAQPSGNHTNSILRVVSNGFSPGIYRLRFSAGEKPEDDPSSYMVSIGLLPGLKGIKMSRNKGELLKD